MVHKHPELAQIIRNYSRDEYVEVSQRLAEAIIVHPPMKIARTVAAWPKNSASVAALMDELRTFEFKPVNLPIRFMLSHFIAFMTEQSGTPGGVLLAGRLDGGRAGVQSGLCTFPALGSKRTKRGVDPVGAFAT